MEEMFAASSWTDYTKVRAICSNEDNLTEKVDGEWSRENLNRGILVKHFEHLKHFYLFYGIELFM